jgi:hypothetical protein
MYNLIINISIKRLIKNLKNSFLIQELKGVSIKNRKKKNILFYLLPAVEYLLL